MTKGRNRPRLLITLEPVVVQRLNNVAKITSLTKSQIIALCIKESLDTVRDRYNLTENSKQEK